MPTRFFRISFLPVLLLVLSIALNPSAGAVEIRFKVSKVHGLLGFVMTLSGEANRPEGIVRLFHESVFDTKEARSLLLDWKKLRPSLDRSTSNPHETIRQGTNQVLIKLFEQSIVANNLVELKKATRSLLSADDHTNLFRILKAFAPAYESLVWKKSLPELTNWQRSLDALTRRVSINTFFSKTAAFYKSNWPQNRAFTIGLYAIPFDPNASNTTNSKSMGDIIEHGVLTLTGKRDASTIADEFAVIYHEMCHSLYDSQSRADAKALDREYLDTLPPHGERAGKLINEALATAIGNGWFYKAIHPKKDERQSWYAEPTINSFALEIFPLVRSYLEQSKTIDSAFVQASVERFAKLK